MLCREAKCGDADCITAVGICVWIDTYAKDGTNPAFSSFVLGEFTSRKAAQMISDKQVYVVEHCDGGVVGYAVVAEGADGADGAEIQNIYVLPRFQACGVGTKLIDHIIEQHERLWLSCWSENDKALRFYASRGFVKTGTMYFELGSDSHLNHILRFGSY